MYTGRDGDRTGGANPRGRAATAEHSYNEIMESIAVTLGHKDGAGRSKPNDPLGDLAMGMLGGLLGVPLAAKPKLRGFSQRPQISADKPLDMQQPVFL